MGKHNGKARKTGLPVGKTLENASKHRRSKAHDENPSREQSVLEMNNVDDMMTMAELAGKDFAAEREKVLVLDTYGTTALEQKATAEQLSDIHQKYGHIIRAPRRPSWRPNQTPEEIDRQEKASFLNWRRALAQLHEREPSVLLTPYEKNLEVWRQLWRVLEFSNILVQIVDARDPLFYYSEDLVSYAKELDPDAQMLILLNKADLVPSEVRRQWAKYFEFKGLRYAFWSAKHSTDESAKLIKSQDDSRICVFGVKEVLDLFESLSPPSKVTSRSAMDRGQQQNRTIVGFVGYPNVGKSSTINALFGRKKTPVASTPGRTKHFQTLNTRDTLCLCDCPGLVLPALAKSKASMVVAGVIPIDRLVDVVSPVRVILSRIGMLQFRQAYGLSSSDIGRIGNISEADAAQAIASLAQARGWTQAAGRPDQTRSGRQIIKDYTNGHLVHCESPPGHVSLHRPKDEGRVDLDKQEDISPEKEDDRVIGSEDQLLSECIEVETEIGKKPRRAAHKFHRKPPRQKGNRGRQYNDNAPATSRAFVKGDRGSLTHGLLGNST